MCISWTGKGLTSLMHGVTMKTLRICLYRGTYIKMVTLSFGQGQSKKLQLLEIHYKHLFQS